MNKWVVFHSFKRWTDKILIVRDIAFETVVLCMCLFSFYKMDTNANILSTLPLYFGFLSYRISLYMSQMTGLNKC